MSMVAYSQKSSQMMETNTLGYDWYLSSFSISWVSVSQEISRIAMDTHLGVSKNNGTPKSSILIGFSIINHPFWGTPIFGNIHLT